MARKVPRPHKPQARRRCSGTPGKNATSGGCAIKRVIQLAASPRYSLTTFDATEVRSSLVIGYIKGEGAIHLGRVCGGPRDTYVRRCQIAGLRLE